MEKDANAEDYLPRSLYVPQEDPRQNMREIVDSIFSDKFMIFLSIILIPIILIPFLVDVSPAVFAFLDMCDMAIVLLFVAEYVLKLYFASDRWAHFKSPWHLVDLVIVTLPFVQYIPIVELSATGSYSLLLRLLRLPRAFAVGSRAVAGRRVASRPIAETIKLPDTIIRQVDLNLKTTQNGLTWSELRAPFRL